MRIDAFMHSKDRNRRSRGDDTPLVLPGVLGVFDGATDPRGILFKGKSSGLFASQTVGGKCAELFSNGRNFEMPLLDIVSEFSKSITDAVASYKFESLPATTVAMALFCENKIRIIVAGDSGVRVNGTDVHQHLKSIDEVSADARVKAYKILSSKIPDPDQVEIASRRVIFQGLDTALSEGVLSSKNIEMIIQEVCKNQKHVASADIVEEFIRAGIKLQSNYGNVDAHPLGYSTIDGRHPSIKDVKDIVLDVQDVHSLEFFTDGYFDLPEGVSIHAWEEKFSKIEKEDFHKIGSYQNVKGSTTKEFSDDRSIIIASLE